MNIIKGEDLIKLAEKGKFDVIAHGCNCFCIQEAGIAKQMSKTFGTNNQFIYEKESFFLKGDFNKLGIIESNEKYIHNDDYTGFITVVNCYTQYSLGANLDYTALRLCMKKLNHEFKNMHIGLPKIGCGIAGGSWSKVQKIFEEELTNVKLTIVDKKKNRNNDKKKI